MHEHKQLIQLQEELFQETKTKQTATNNKQGCRKEIVS